MRVGIGFEGRFKLEAFNPETGERHSTGWFDNLILNNGLETVGTVAPCNGCRVGTSGDAVDVSQTSLVAHLAYTNTTTSTVYGWDTVGNEYGYFRRTYRFAAGVATGTLREVGVSYSSSSGMFSRALIVDGSGTPTPFTVEADQILDVTYELRYYPKITDTVTVVNINGTDHTFTIRPDNADVNLASASYVRFLGAGGSTVGMQGMSTATVSSYGAISLFGTYLESLSGTSGVSSSTVVISPYVNGSHERVYNYTFTPAQGSVPIVAFLFGSACGNWKATVSPAIPKDATKQLTISTKISWGRRT